MTQDLINTILFLTVFAVAMVLLGCGSRIETEIVPYEIYAYDRDCNPETFRGCVQEKIYHGDRVFVSKLHCEDDKGNCNPTER